MSCCNTRYQNNDQAENRENSCECANNVMENGFRPILCHEQYRQSYRECCDQDGKCCCYPCAARDPFWPEFTHPRSLSCAELYNGEDSRCGVEKDNDCGCSL